MLRIIPSKIKETEFSIKFQSDEPVWHYAVKLFKNGNYIKPTNEDVEFVYSNFIKFNSGDSTKWYYGDLKPATKYTVEAVYMDKEGKYSSLTWMHFETKGHKEKKNPIIRFFKKIINFFLKIFGIK